MFYKFNFQLNFKISIVFNFSSSIDDNLKKVLKELTEKKRLKYWSNVSTIVCKIISRQCFVDLINLTFVLS